MNLRDELVLVTGATGFLGQHIVKLLRQNPPRGLFPFGGRHFDLTNAEQTAAMFEQSHPTAVLHCAATVGGIQANLKSPVQFFRDNLLMGMNVIEACHKYGVAKICCVGSTCSYPDDCPYPFAPESIWQGYPEPSNAPYGIAKRTLLVMLEAYRREHGLEFVYPVLANLYGPGDSFEPEKSHVVPALIRKIVEAHESGSHYVEVWGDGAATRELLYVEDAARGIVELMEQKEGIVNVGSGDEISILYLAKMIQKIVGYEGKLLFDPQQPSGQRKRRLAPGWLRQSLWIEQGLRQTVDWWKALRPQPVSP